MQPIVMWTLLVLVLVGGYFAATAPVGAWRRKRRAYAVLRHLIRHHEAVARRAA